MEPKKGKLSTSLNIHLHLQEIKKKSTKLTSKICSDMRIISKVRENLVKFA